MEPDSGAWPTPVSLSRRALVLGSVLGATGCAALGGSGPGGPEGAPGGAEAVMPAMSLPLTSLVAVRVFPTYRGEVYAQHDAVLARLGDLGVRRISHKLTPTLDERTIEFTQRAFREHGIMSWLTVGEPRVPLDDGEWAAVETLLRGPLAGMVERCFGWNEPNHSRSGAPLREDWPELTAAHQRELWTRVEPLGIAVGTPQLWSGSLETHDRDLQVLAPLIENSFDHVAWHLYPRGDTGVTLIDRFEETYRRLLGEFPVVCTEAGYLDAARYTGGAANLTPAQKGSLVPQLVDAYTDRGYGLSYFELLDDPDPSDSKREAGLGLVECEGLDPSTWRNKPAFYALRSRLDSA